MKKTMLEIVMNEVLSNALNYIYYYLDDNATLGDIDFWLSNQYEEEVIDFLKANKFYVRISEAMRKKNLKIKESD